jgi:hypothetical protein
VTSLFGPEQLPLVSNVREAVERGEDVEAAFSRGRSFTRKYRKYGPGLRGVPELSADDDRECGLSVEDARECGGGMALSVTVVALS